MLINSLHIRKATLCWRVVWVLMGVGEGKRSPVVAEGSSTGGDVGDCGLLTSWVGKI